MSKRRVTLYDVAERAGVSTQTVARVVNNKGEISEKTRHRVLHAIKELGYRPSRLARGLATRKTFLLGLVVPDISNPYFAGIARGVEEAAWSRGYNLLLCNTDEDLERERSVLHALDEARVDAIILCGPRLDDEELGRLLERLPASVLVNRDFDAARTGVVLLENAEGIRKAVSLLLDGGRRRLAMLAGPMASYGGRERVQGFREALGAAGLPASPALRRYCPPTIKGGRQVGELLLREHPEIDSLVCYNDLVAIGAIQACRALGRRVPEEVAVVGHDNIPMAAQIEPPLTTLDISQYRLGIATAELLFRRMGGEISPDKIRISPELIVRASAP